MEDRGIEPTAVTWGTALAACARCGDWQKALGLLKQMREKVGSAAAAAAGCAPLPYNLVYGGDDGKCNTQQSKAILTTASLSPPPRRHHRLLLIPQFPLLLFFLQHLLLLLLLLLPLRVSSHH